MDGLLASLAPDVQYRLGHHDDLTWEPPVEVAEVTGGVVHDEGGVRELPATLFRWATKE